MNAKNQKVNTQREAELVEARVKRLEQEEQKMIQKIE
jgi:hypothetical protein